MFCKYCGNKIPESAKFCPKCGKNIAIKSEQKSEEAIAEKESAKETVQSQQTAESDAETESPANEEKGISIEKAAFDDFESKTREKPNYSQEEQKPLQQAEQERFEKSSKESQESPKRQFISALLNLFLGTFGIHRYYAGKIVTAVLQTIFGIFYLYGIYMTWGDSKIPSAINFLWLLPGFGLFGSISNFVICQCVSWYSLYWYSLTDGYIFFIFIFIFTFPFTLWLSIDFILILRGSFKDKKKRLLKKMTAREKQIVVVIFAMSLIIAIVRGGLCCKEYERKLERDSYYQKIKLYKSNAYPVVEDAEKRLNWAVDDYKSKPTFYNAEIMDKAGLDCFESYLNYYKGMAEVDIHGDFSGMNAYMENIIATIEKNHTLTIGGGYRNFESRMNELRSEWRSVRRQ